VRIGVFHDAPYYLRYYTPALVELADRGHRLLLARPDRYDEVQVPRGLRKRRRVTTALYPWNRSDGGEQAAAIVRSARDFARYSSPPLEAAHANRARAYERLVRSVVGKARSLSLELEPPDLSLGAADLESLDGLFRGLEAAIPPDEGIRRFIRDHRLDVVLGISRVNIATRQTEVFKAARDLGIPSGLIVYSWDNLSSKGLIHELPDRVFVWNEVQAQEAAELHCVPRERIVVTGAARFDAVFAASPSAERESLRSELGLEPGRKTLLWLGSSAFVAPREPEIVERWLAALRTSPDPGLRTANVVVRPHPGTVAKGAWADWRPPAGAVLPPPVVRDRAQDLYDQLVASDAVVGLNTSAEIEAAVAGRPVLTLEPGESDAPGQEGSIHYRYLLVEHGGFVERASTMDQHLEQLLRALADDPLADARQRFLETFVRPLGLGRAVSPLLADAILELGGGSPLLRLAANLRR
jgi:hypothetical protein